MEAVTDVVFRHVIAEAARPDVFFTEFTNTNSYCSPKGEHSTRGRLAFTDDEQPLVAHIWGDRPEYFAQMSRGLAERGFRGIDINMGCPAPNVAPKGSGSGLIRRPEVAAELIAAAKEGGLPVSVKTRLGYTYVDEWRDWLTHLLRQDIANLSIHLRTKKEMSKVDAHFELIPEIKKLRDEIAPQTLLTINGDIRDRQHGLELVEQHGVDGVMIGRGVFHNPFAFEKAPAEESRSVTAGAKHLQPESEPTPGLDLTPGAKPFGEGSNRRGEHTKEELLGLLRLHLDLFDKYSTELEPRRYEPLKRFFKIYVRDFDGSKELRDKLMHTKSTQEVREILKNLK